MLANDNQNVSPKAIWIAEAGQTVIQPATVIGRSLLLATQDSKLKSEGSKIQAFSLSDGKERWQYEFENARISGIQALRSESPKAEVAIVTASSAGSNVSKSWIVAIEESGKLRWQSSINATSFSAPHIQNEIIYLTSDANKLFVFAPKVSLEPVRQVSLDAVPSPAAPAVKEGTVFIPCQSSELLAVTQDGAARWRFEFNNEGEDWLDKTPTVSAGRVFCSSSGGRVFALDAASGELLWRVSIGDGLSLSEPVVHDSHVCVGTHSGLVALDIHNGWPVWTLETPRPVSAAPLVFGNTLFFTSQDHHLYAVDGGTGQEKWRYGLGRRIEMPPLIAQDILVVIDRGGMIVGFSGLSSLDLVQKSDPAHETAQIDLWQKAKNYERNAQPLKAAALWMELGEIDKAAQQYEVAESWEEAVNAWEKLANYDRRAVAFEQQAKNLNDQEINAEEKALAWEEAARAYRETSHTEARLRCEREVARWRQQPLIDIRANPGEMTLNSWTEIEYAVLNSGYGLASNVTVSLKGQRFEDQSQQTLSSPKLGPGGEFSQRMRIRPREQGGNVPLEFAVEFIDNQGKEHRDDRTIPVRVVSDMPAESQAQSAITITQLSASNLAELAKLSSDDRDLPALYNKMVQYLSQDELELILVELGLKKEDFSPKISLLTKDLIVIMTRSGRLDKLIEKCRSRRPNIVW